MDLVDYLITNISKLDHIVRWPGIFLIILYLLRAVGHVFRLKLISVVTHILYATIIALVLARYGNDIAAFLYDLLEQYQSTNREQPS